MPKQVIDRDQLIDEALPDHTRMMVFPRLRAQVATACGIAVGSVSSTSTSRPGDRAHALIR